MAELSLLTSGLLASGTIADFIGALQQGRNDSLAARLNATIAERNASAAMQDAVAAQLATLRSVEDIELIGRLRRGSMVATSAASGVQADTGSPLEALAADAFQTGKAAGETHFQGAMQVHKLEVEAAQERFKQAFLKKQAKRARTQAIIGAISGLASSAAIGAPTYMRGFAVAKSLLSPQAQTSPGPSSTPIIFGQPF